MDRLACVDVAAFPLQQLLRAHPEWAGWPVAVVEDDRPQARVLWINRAARRLGVQIGQRYATALSLVRDLHASTVSRTQIEESIRELTVGFRQYSPHVEPSSDTPGVFWLDASGLERLYPSLRVWAEAIRGQLRSSGWMASVAVGFSRFGAYALAMAHQDTVCCETPDEERALVEHVPLARLTIEPDVRERLLALGLQTVGDFLRLPGDAIRTRFGEATDMLFQLAAGHRWAPLVPVPVEECYEHAVEFDAPERHVERLVFVVKRVLDGLVTAITRHVKAITGLVFHLTLDDRTQRAESLRPAAPTLDVAQLLTLVRLRFDTLHLPSGIVTLHVTAETCPATAEQQRLFADARRDAHAANHALARLRAEWGEQAVVRARLCDAHMPAARFTWEPLDQVSEQAVPRVVATRPLVRRIFMPARPVTTGLPIDGRRIRASGLHELAPEVCMGPYVLSGGWWGGTPRDRQTSVLGGGLHRDYFFVRTDDELRWIYYDHRQGRLFLQGRVE